MFALVMGYIHIYSTPGIAHKLIDRIAFVQRCLTTVLTPLFDRDGMTQYTKYHVCLTPGWPLWCWMTIISKKETQILQRFTLLLDGVKLIFWRSTQFVGSIVVKLDRQTFDIFVEFIKFPLMNSTNVSKRRRMNI